MPFKKSSLSGLSSLGLLTVCLVPVAANAQQGVEGSNQLEEVIVTSSGVPVARRTIGTTVEVITQEDITRFGNLSLLDILRQQPAIAATNSGGPGKTSALRIRGEEGYRTLSIYDGLRLSDASAPQVTPLFEHTQSGGVGRVEILKGPQGLSYGADAGGVVNMTSPVIAQGNEFDIASEWGEFGTRQVDASVVGNTGQVDYFLSVSDLETDGFNTRQSDNVLQDDDGYENTTVHGRLGFAITDNWIVKAVHREVDAASEYDGCFSGTTVHDCDSEYDLSASRLSVDYTGNGMSHSLGYSVSRTERAEYALRSYSFGGEGELERLEYLGSLSELPGFDLVVGADWEGSEADGNSRDNVGVYAEYLSDFSDELFINVGARHDDNDDYGTNTSLRVSAAYLLTLDEQRQLKFKSSYGTGFRAPSLYEIAYNAGPSASPPASNTQLVQEESEGWEAGVEFFNTDGLYLGLIYFDQDIDNAITFDLQAFSGYLQDVGRSNSRGVEASMEVPVTERLSVLANYTYNKTEQPDGQTRLRRPENLFNLGLNLTALNDQLHFNLYYRSASDAVDSVFGARTPLTDYGVVDASMRYAFTSNIEVYGRLENATDEQYEEVAGFYTAERAAYMGLRLQF